MLITFAFTSEQRPVSWFYLLFRSNWVKVSRLYLTVKVSFGVRLEGRKILEAS